jgi:UDP-glucuronate 4-epimerase
MKMRWLVTGTAGFIGFHVARRLLEEGHEVAGIDGMTSYYDVKLKGDRHALLSRSGNFSAHLCMLEDSDGLGAIARRFSPDVVVHLAAQAGVRYSLENPRAYLGANVVGSFNVLELCRALRPRHVLMASTSSVYGESMSFPLAETDRTDYPLTPYAASKKAMEAIAHSYAHLWDVPTTILRFFTVYGPWGRPDMAPFKFVRNILAGQPIDIYNRGNMQRDFTYIDDVVEAILRLSEKVPSRGAKIGASADSVSPVAPYRVVNVGGHQPVGLLEFIDCVEQTVGRPAVRKYVEMQQGDVTRTAASTTVLEALIGSRPTTPLSAGIEALVRWYREYYGV